MGSRYALREQTVIIIQYLNNGKDLVQSNNPSTLLSKTFQHDFRTMYSFFRSTPVVMSFKINVLFITYS